jgi:8-amino-7-oxononanoate synthase
MAFFVKAILSPTVKEGSERLRICFHDFNTLKEVNLLIAILNKTIELN